MRRNRLLFYGFLFVILLASCVNELSNIRAGKSFRGSTHGLLVGSIVWKQGGRWVGGHMAIDLKNLETGKSYTHHTKGKDFQLSLPPGRYSPTTFRIARPNIRKSLVRRTVMTASLLLLWLNQYTIPYGVAIGPLRDRNFNTKPNLPVFEIIQQEATDIGIVVVEIPDPLPLGRLRTKISVRSHRYSQESELKKHFPGIKKLQKVLLINPEGRENDPI